MKYIIAGDDVCRYDICLYHFVVHVTRTYLQSLCDIANAKYGKLEYLCIHTMKATKSVQR